MLDVVHCNSIKLWAPLPFYPKDQGPWEILRVDTSQNKWGGCLSSCIWYKLHGGGNSMHRPVTATSSFDRGVLQCYFKSRSVQLKEMQQPWFYTDSLTAIYLCSYLCWLRARWENTWLLENRYQGFLLVNNKTLCTRIMTPALQKSRLAALKSSTQKSSSLASTLWSNMKYISPRTASLHFKTKHWWHWFSLTAVLLILEH